MTHWLRVLTISEENQEFDFEALFWSPWAPGTHMVQRYTWQTKHFIHILKKVL